MVPGQLLFSRKAGSQPVSPHPSHDYNTSVSTPELYFTLIGSAITLNACNNVNRSIGNKVNRS